MDDDIVLDTNVLQSLATDLTAESNKVNKDVIDCSIRDCKKIVEALTSSQVLGKVLTPEEAIILKDYFSQKIPLSEKVLATLDIALDKILRRAHEFHDDKQELNAFLKDRDSAKAKLLMRLSPKIARENFQYIQAAIGDTYRYSKDMAYRSAALTYETAARSKELAEIGASVGAQMTSDAAK
ncbi:hypothetical protein DINM_005048 [Dirofilaria immitis]|nr:hypothetical protein [Dirofilaria immitis]